MEYSITVDSQRNLLIVRTEGRINIPSYRSLLLEVFSHPACKEGYDILIDHSKSSVGHLYYPDIKAISDLFKMQSNKIDLTQMGVVVREGDYGLGRMWQIITSDDVQFECFLFKSMDEARNHFVVRQSP